MTLEGKIEGVFAGCVAKRWSGKPPSAIGKQRVQGRVDITELGLATDAQADLSVHGGREKALHHYASAHYQAWRAELERDDLQPGSFGENLASAGLTEETVCIGDVFTLGSAKVQVSQGRQPCWKLNAHTDEGRMAWLFQKTGRTGWYYRVVSTGSVASGDAIVLIERPCPDWTVQRVTRARLTRRIDPVDATTLAQLPELSADWRAAFKNMAQGTAQDDSGRRLHAP